MLTQTSESAIRLLVWMALHDQDERPIPPHTIAKEIDASPSYLAKVTRMLVKSNILRSYRGAQGGVRFARKPDDVTLLEVVEACQGLLIGNYCQNIKEHIEPTCAFHQAMAEVHAATTAVLEHWTIGDMARKPHPDVPHEGEVECRIACAARGCEAYKPNEPSRAAAPLAATPGRNGR